MKTQTLKTGMVYEKSRCGLGKTMAEKLVLWVLLLCCLIMLQQVMNQAIIEEYRVRHYQRKLLFSQIMDVKQKMSPSQARRKTRCWVRPGRTSAWWDNFLNGVMLE